jgi:hypothetical protein
MEPEDTVRYGATTPRPGNIVSLDGDIFDNDSHTRVCITHAVVVMPPATEDDESIGIRDLHSPAAEHLAFVPKERLRLHQKSPGS